MDSMARFLAKLKEIIKGLVKDGNLSEDDFNSAVRKAAGHAGGMARWTKPDEGGNHMNEFKLLGEIALSEDGSTGQVQIFPAVGKYTHPRYGELDISKGFLSTVKGNFDAKVYQQELPLTIDLEHQTALSGAAGWISDVEIRGDTGMWATVSFNDRGKSLVGADAYRYFSPEFYDKWTDPASNEGFKNVLIGGALTNRPFFKGMSPVAMMTEEAMYFMEPVQPDMDILVEVDLAPDDTGITPDEPADIQDDAKGGTSMGMSEEETRQFAEMRESLEKRLCEAEESRKAAESEVKSMAESLRAASERVSAMERDATRKSLSEFIRDNRLAFQGEVDQAVDRLEGLKAKLSESEWTEYMDERKVWHAQMKESALLKPIGGPGSVATGPEAEVESAVQKAMADNQGMTRPDAISKVMRENPGLYARYDKAQNQRARGGN